MKALSAFAALTLAAQISLAATTLVKSTTWVGFAPPQHQGAFTTEILSNGTIQYVNNKGIVKKMGKLSSEALQNLKAEVATLKAGDLVGETDGPACMDAPSTYVTVYQDGVEIKTKEEAGCKEQVLPSAWKLNQVIDAAVTMCYNLIAK